MIEVPMTLKEAEEHLAWLEKKIAACTSWGAYLGALDEEARGLRRYLASFKDSGQ